MMNSELKEKELEKAAGGLGSSYFVYGFVCPFCGKDHCFDMDLLAISASGDELFACDEVGWVSMYPGSDALSVYSWKRDEIRGATATCRGGVNEGVFYRIKDY